MGAGGEWANATLGLKRAGQTISRPFVFTGVISLVGSEAPGAHRGLCTAGNLTHLCHLDRQRFMMRRTCPLHERHQLPGREHGFLKR